MNVWIIVAVGVGVLLGIASPFVYRYLAAWYRCRQLSRLDERVIARKVVTFDTPEEMDATLRRVSKGDMSVFFEK